MEGVRTVTKTYAVTLPLLLLWLVCWISVSWGAVQDDAFIHLRYAANLQLHHFITYDGVHANYGASSLLYVSGLAILRGLTSSPDLPHATSSVMHLLLFGGLSMLFARIAVRSEIAGKAGLVLLLLLSTPSAVRWLDDGMETVVAVAVVSLLAWLIHGEVREGRRRGPRIWLRYGLIALLAFFAVLLRVELSLMCVAGFVLLTMRRMNESRNWWETPRVTALRLMRAMWQSSPVAIGCGLALAAIYSTMHVLLPDTALAKSHGIRFWSNPLHDTAYTLSGAFSFGAGLGVFWVLTLFLMLRTYGRPTAITVLANSLFPALLAVAVWRGQEIQGVRYFAWTFFFSIVWNILELSRQVTQAAPPSAGQPSNSALVHGFVAMVLLLLPVEGVVMHRVLAHRQATLRLFESQRLDVLRTRRGVASDIGFIGYFTRANLCDLAGLVNGRAAGGLSSQQRVQACAATDPDFVFVNLSQLLSVARAMDLSGWQMCGNYDFTNVTRPDRHYLVVRPSIAAEVCRATGRAPQSINALVPPADVSIEGLKADKALMQ